jgi:hypothetical protein
VPGDFSRHQDRPRQRIPGPPDKPAIGKGSRLPTEETGRLNGQANPFSSQPAPFPSWPAMAAQRHSKTQAGWGRPEGANSEVVGGAPVSKPA